MNILIPNIGRRGYLVKYIKKDIHIDNMQVFVSDCDDTASGLYGPNDGHFILSKPVDDSDKYVSELISLCEKNKVSIIIPVIDPEIFILANYKKLFESKGIFVNVSDKDVLDICYNKEKMNSFLIENGFIIPRTYNNINNFLIDLKNEKISFPIILKPIYGSGSVSTYKVQSTKELLVLFNKGMIIQEYIDGQEYGVDVFNDLNRMPIRCVIKKKIAMRSGETDKALTILDSHIQTTMITLAKKLGHIGNVDCDILVKNGIIYVIDLNPRFGGGYPITHEAGVNLLELVIQMSQGKSLEAQFDNYIPNLLVMKEIAVTKTIYNK